MSHDPISLPIGCVATVRELSIALNGVVSERTFNRLVEYEGFPIAHMPDGQKYYRIADVVLYLAANPKTTKKIDLLKDYRMSRFQRDVANADDVQDKDAEVAKWTKVKREREELKLKKDRAILVDRQERNEDESERLNIIKRRMYEAARAEAPKALAVENLGDMIQTLEGLWSIALTNAQNDFIEINKIKAEEAKAKELEADDVVQDEFEELE